MARYLVSLLKPNDQSTAGLMARGASGTFILKMVNTGLGFITAVLLARVLGIRGYGIYAYAISWITLLGVIARLGLDQTIGRYVAVYQQYGDRPRIHGLLRFSFAVVTGSAVICLLLAGTVAWFCYRESLEMLDALWLSFLLLPVNALMVPCISTQMGLQKVIPAQVPSLFVQPVGFLFLVGGTWLIFPEELTPSRVLVLCVLMTGLSLALSAWLLRRALMSDVNNISTAKVRPVYEVRAWLKSAIPLMLMGGMFLANANTDILMLGAMVGPEAAAVYKSATRGAELVVFSLGIILIPLAPLIVKLHTSGDWEQLQKLISKSAQLVFVLSVVTACPLIIYGKQFLRLFGYEFVQGQMALNILIMGQLVNSAAGISGTILVMCGLERRAAIGLFCGAISNAAMNMIFIPIWGINGAALATSASTIIWVSTLTYYVIKDLGLNPTILCLHNG